MNTKLTYLEFKKIQELNIKLNSQVKSFKVNPVKIISSTVKDLLGQCELVKPLTTDSEDLQAWIVTYKENRPRYIVIYDPINRIVVTDETSLDITAQDSVIRES